MSRACKYHRSLYDLFLTRNNTTALCKFHWTRLSDHELNTRDSYYCFSKTRVFNKSVYGHVSANGRLSTHYLSPALTHPSSTKTEESFRNNRFSTFQSRLVSFYHRRTYNDNALGDTRLFRSITAGIMIDIRREGRRLNVAPMFPCRGRVLLLFIF